MLLSPGVRLGPYEVAALIGEGGMGKVWRAHHIALKRDDALKVLPDAFASDPDRLARFQREAQILASLNHPNIAHVHGLEQADGVQALVMELVEGQTLADRIAHGPIPVDEALPIAKQIAQALEAAHEQGIVHRDLKPANIKVRPDSTVKVLDFGLAKALEPMSARDDATASPTITSPAMMTGVGMLLGTAAYMSPEQARGKPVDKRADIWAFGCVLYEMLTGKRAFAGEDVSETLAAVLKSDPSWSALPSDLPPAIRWLLRRCLTKDLKGRIGDASIARIEIDEVQRGPYLDGEMIQKTPRRRERLAWISALVLVALIGAVMAVRAFRPVPTVPEMRLEINTPPTTDSVSLAISPDGQKLVFVATAEGRSGLWLRPLDAVSARPLAGTDRASLPFWSPDSRSVGFFADGKLKRIDIDGGLVQTLADAREGRGGTWNRDGTILFTPVPGSPIFRIAATGGEPAAVTRLERPQEHHGFPAFLPDGRHFLYYVRGGPEARGVYIGQLDGSQTRRFLDADAPAVHASSGHLLFVRQGTLFAQRLDPARLELTGNPVPVAERIRLDFDRILAAVSVSAAGPLVYRSGSAGQPQFVWVDRFGKEMGKVGGPDSLGAWDPSISPDDRRVALCRIVEGNTDVWLLDLGRNTVSRFTSDAAEDLNPLWSPDGTRIVFSSNRKGALDLYQKPASGAGNEDLLLATAQIKFATDWSLDGRFLLYFSRSGVPKTGLDIWALPMDGDRKPFPVVQTNFDERDGQFSPDGKWISYVSNESGRFEIYVQPFPGTGGRSLISTTGGDRAHWRRDGKELFYVAPDNRLVAVPIQLAANGQAVEAGAPVPLFRMPIGGDGDYIVASAGQRFLVSTVTEEATSPITVILNWKPRP